MNARFAVVVLLALLGIFHAQIWLGRGSVPKVNTLKQELAEQTQANEQARLRNEQLANEVRDLQEGLDMVEEHALFELGMVKPSESFVQVAPPAL